MALFCKDNELRFGMFSNALLAIMVMALLFKFT